MGRTSLVIFSTSLAVFVAMIMTAQVERQRVTTADGIIQYKLGCISDLDDKSKVSDGWISFYKRGSLDYNPKTDNITIQWNDEAPVEFKSTNNHEGRGMELSELVLFGDKLLAVDDKTGIVYTIEGNTVTPWVTLKDGNGQSEKGLKAEWATVKGDTLYVGGIGKEWTTTSGEFVNDDPMWVKTISKTGEINHINWKNNYLALRKALDIEFPGYLIHESVAWSEINQKWFFLPRTSSTNKYTPEDDEKSCTNVLLSANEDFSKVEVTHIGEVVPTHGFSSFKFVPDSEDKIIVALKTEEVQDKKATYVTAFKTDGTILVPENLIANVTYEGLEFV